MEGQRFIAVFINYHCERPMKIANLTVVFKRTSLWILCWCFSKKTITVNDFVKLHIEQKSIVFTWGGSHKAATYNFECLFHFREKSMHMQPRNQTRHLFFFANNQTQHSSLSHCTYYHCTHMSLVTKHHKWSLSIHSNRFENRDFKS